MEDASLLFPESSSRPISITEAAQKLGVSERTIYRMLKSGKLERVIVSDKLVGVADMEQEVSGNHLRSGESRVILSGNGDSLSDILHRELRAKDVQIEQLLSAQKELGQTVSRLQEQIFELAKLVVTLQVQEKNAKQERETVPAASGQPSPQPALRLLNLFRRRG